MYVCKITDTYLPWVSKHLNGTIPDVLMSYPITLWFCMEVSHLYKSYLSPFII